MHTHMHIHIIEHTHLGIHTYMDLDNSLPGTLALTNSGPLNGLPGDFRLASKKLIRKGAWLLGPWLNLFPAQCAIQLHWP